MNYNYKLRLTQTSVQIGDCVINTNSKNHLEAVSEIIKLYKKLPLLYENIFICNPYNIRPVSSKTILSINDIDTGQLLFRHYWRNF